VQQNHGTYRPGPKYNLYDPSTLDLGLIWLIVADESVYKNILNATDPYLVVAEIISYICRKAGILEILAPNVHASGPLLWVIPPQSDGPQK
jgi:hypothetical protein